MAKVILGARPKVFAPFPVKFTMPDGTEGVISVTYKYRTRSEFGQMLDSILEAANVTPAEPVVHTALEGAPTSVDPLLGIYERIGVQTRDANVDHLLLSVEAWDLPQPMTRETLVQLAEEVPAATIAMMAAYHRACTEGRLGN